MPRLPRQPLVWFAAFLLWFATLWLLSSGPVAVKTGLEIPHLDKLVHFGYFFGGAGLLHAAVFLGSGISRLRRHLLVVAILAAIGILDEWHQSWVPQRSGNDPADWTADVLGAIAGGLVFDRSRRLFIR